SSSGSAVRSALPRLGRVPREPDRLEACDGLLEKRLVLAYCSEGPEREGLDVCSLLKVLGSLRLDPLTLAEGVQRVEERRPGGDGPRFELVGVEVVDQVPRAVELASREREPNLRRMELPTVALHPDRLRFFLEPARLAVVTR